MSGFRLTHSQARAKGWIGTRPKKTPAQIAYAKVCRENNHGEAAFIRAWEQNAGIDFPFERQVMFHPGRNWKFDFYDEATLTAVEVDGGLHQEINVEGNRFANKTQAAQDREKRNAAVQDGIACLVYSPDEIESDPRSVISQVLLVLEKRRRDKT